MSTPRRERLRALVPRPPRCQRGRMDRTSVQIRAPAFGVEGWLSVTRLDRPLAEGTRGHTTSKALRPARGPHDLVCRGLVFQPAGRRAAQVVQERAGIHGRHHRPPLRRPSGHAQIAYKLEMFCRTSTQVVAH